jgi:hypothetical protein
MPIVFSKEWSWTSGPLPQPWHSLLLAIVSVGLMFLSARSYVGTRDFLDSAARADGRVVKMRNAGGVHYPVVSFSDSSGTVHILESATGTNPPAYQLGDSVIVLYSPSKPVDARIQGFGDLWFRTVLQSGIGLALGIVSVLLWIFRRSLFPQYRKEGRSRKGKSGH